MVKIVAAGSNEFVVGFRLAGIKNTVEIGKSPYSELKSLKGNRDLGIIIVDEKIIGSLEPHQRTEMESSVEPVFIPMSTKVEQESLKKLIKKSVGVDLWK